MRDKNRIEPFMQELGDIWKENVPDWRFGQFMDNIFDVLRDEGKDPFMLEDDDIIKAIKNMF